MRRNEDELNKMRRAGKVVAEMHEKTRETAKPGVTTLELDQVARDVLDRRGATSNFLHYHGFPAVICTSPNNMIVHGIPGGYVLEEGDILSIDCGAIIEGYHGDAAFTMGIGTISKEAQKLIEVTERSLWAGIEQMVKGNGLHEIGRAVQDVAEAAGFSVVREYVGHAIGTAMHEQPQVPNYWPGTRGPIMKTGNVFAVEPMVNVGSPETVTLDDNWSVVTADGALSAHFEHTIAVTADGPEVFTLP
jgi:methionyl aminopeptidase